MAAFDLITVVLFGHPDPDIVDKLRLADAPAHEADGFRAEAYADDGDLRLILADLRPQVIFTFGEVEQYPNLLAQPIDVMRYVRDLEEALIRTCADLGLHAIRVEGRSGVWFAADDGDGTRPPRRERKVAAIGVRVAKGVTMHGFALNCEPDLHAFDRIVPCGIDDADVTSLSLETGRRVTIDEVVPLVRGHLVATLTPLLAGAADPAGTAEGAAPTTDAGALAPRA